MDNLILGLGSLISILLAINAFFTRKTLEKISNVELKLAVLIERHDATDERSRQNSKEIERLKELIHRINLTNCSKSNN